MSPQRNRGAKGWKARVRHPDGRSRVCGCDTRRRATAVDIENWARSLYNDRRTDVLDAIVSGRIALPDAYDHRNDLATLIARLDDLDVEPYVAKWHAVKSKARKGAKSADNYLAKVRVLIPEGKRFSRSKFTAKEIRRHLRALDVQEPTRNRHKAALSSFASFLVDEDVLARNLVRDVEGWSEGEGRTLYYERADAERIIAALPQPHAALEALMVGAGFEWQACERLRVRDVDLAVPEAFAHGGKSPWRRRLCRIVEAWCVPYVRPALAGKLPDALVFDGMTESRALKLHQKTVRELMEKQQVHATVVSGPSRVSTLHDWRHTHAVLMLRAGYKPTVVAHQLGHRDTSLTWRRYGRFAVDSRDYQLPDREKGKEARA